MPHLSPIIIFFFLQQTFLSSFILLYCSQTFLLFLFCYHSFLYCLLLLLLFPLVSPNVRTHFYLCSCSSITLSFIVSYTVHKHFYLCSCSSITLPLTPSYCSQTFLYSFFVFCFPFKASHSVLKMLPTHLCL